MPIEDELGSTPDGPPPSRDDEGGTTLDGVLPRGVGTWWRGVRKKEIAAERARERREDRADDRVDNAWREALETARESAKSKVAVIRFQWVVIALLVAALLVAVFDKTVGFEFLGQSFNGGDAGEAAEEYQDWEPGEELLGDEDFEDFDGLPSQGPER